ncbi:MAG: integrase [Planctomycetota bacterium]
MQLGSIMMRGMVIDMKDEQLHTLAQLQAFVDGTVAVDFSVKGEERYGFIARTLRRFGYVRLKRPDKGVVLRFLGRVSGYSRQQLTRLVQRVRAQAPLLKRYRASRTSFARTFSNADVLLLAHTDTLHGTLSGLATKKLMERAYGVFGETRYERLATISVAHLYNLRKRSGYLRHRQVWTKTRPVTIAIGERRAPAPNNRPGYLRVDTVHQGDQDGVKGLYHINAVDCVTQYEVVATCERISEAYLIPVLEALLRSFPFVILGFHSDNGSEFINGPVVKLLNKLLIEEQTKSRSRHSNDNAQAESKNGAIVRKHLGYSHIPQRFAALVNAFDRDYLNPYVNFHRPCLFAETITDAKGRQRKRYPYKLMMTPYEKFKSLPLAEQFLKSGITFPQLDAQASAMSDNEAAERLNNARATLFKTIFNRSKTAA